ncbi:MAG: 50S ribosomal protein L31e [Candidatus Aenigmarchaeota archaeon]|nr:50S ribosomal protein L31e [Candidatus Aenigmarchaeota archaeon]
MEERIYTINLRKAISKAPRWEKSKKSIAVVRNFLKRHMKGDEVKIGKSITEEIWNKGSQNPPRSIRIHAIQTEEDEKKIIKAELLGVPFPAEKEKKKEVKEEEKTKEEAKKGGTKTEEKPKEEAKKEEKT